MREAYVPVGGRQSAIPSMVRRARSGVTGGGAADTRARCPMLFSRTAGQFHTSVPTRTALRTSCAELLDGMLGR
ncbi:hypothetical protein [Streptomyces sp. Isolate_219]|uniref:hypothetical protein n=1 Tax=Streptomyces sp. Isolate_219 TaxID=2950110 RepID=UPI0021C90DAF|nr:hypothetical protein [Streptomyces sp. Isolate_219]MCR8573343.1 hypothetical protein [Streptomyces sp. Isolate_219]